MSDKTFDPSEHGYQEVLDYLASVEFGGEEFQRVIDAERAGKARKTVLALVEDSPAPPVPTEHDDEVEEHEESDEDSATPPEPTPDAADQPDDPVSDDESELGGPADTPVEDDAPDPEPEVDELVVSATDVDVAPTLHSVFRFPSSSELNPAG